MLNIISPKIGLSILKKRLESQLGVKCDYIKVMYYDTENKIDFILPIEGKEKRFKYEYNADAFIKLIKTKIKDSIQDGNINFVEIYYSKNEAYMNTYFTDKENNKKKLTLEL